MNKSKGLVTIPTDVDVVSGTLELMERWGADALRDCDGTDFPQELRDVDGVIVRNARYPKEVFENPKTDRMKEFLSRFRNA